MNTESFIGIFDSGVGGLAVVNTLSYLLPNENFLYVADSKNFPYGTKTKSQIEAFSKRIVKFLLGRNVKAIVVACNTVSSIAIPELKRIAYPIPVFGMIQAGARIAVKATKNKKVAVISTPLTARSHAYKKEIQKIDRDIKVFEIGSQRMVNLVEDGNSRKKYAYNLVREKLKGVLSSKVDTLVLGCTHFPFLYKVVKNVVGEGIEIVDPSDELAEELKEFLEEKHFMNHSSIPSKKVFFTTGDAKEFLLKAKLFLKDPPQRVYELDV